MGLALHEVKSIMKSNQTKSEKKLACQKLLFTLWDENFCEHF
jgi:hypothetical protein